MFDDLIPNSQARGLSFDDLVPAAPAEPPTPKPVPAAPPTFDDLIPTMPVLPGTVPFAPQGEIPFAAQPAVATPSTAPAFVPQQPPGPVAPALPQPQAGDVNAPSYVSGPFVQGTARLKAGLAWTGYMFQGVPGLSSTKEDVIASIMEMRDVQRRYPKDPAVLAGEAEFEAASGFSGGVMPFLRNPKFLASSIAENLPSSAPSIVGGVAGGLGGALAGPVAAGVGAKTGLTIGSAISEYGNSILQYANENKIPLETPAQINAFLDDSETLDKAHWYAVKRSGAVSAFDLIGAHYGGKIATRFFVPGTGVAKKTAGVLGGIGFDALTEGAGEATASLVTKGEIDVKEAVAEGFLGSITSGAQVMIAPTMERIAAAARTTKMTEADLDRSVAEFFKDLPQAQPGEANAVPAGSEEVRVASDTLPPPGPVWYSAAKRTIEEKIPQISSPEQVLATLRNAPGVKAEELEWTGLLDWVAGQKGKISKNELLSEAEARAIRVEETVLSNDPQNEVRLNPLGKWEVVDAGGNVISVHEQSSFAWSAARKTTESRRPKFTEYLLPGPYENPKEVLLTLPEKPEAEPRGPRGWGDTDGGTRGSGENYTEPHWPDVPNPVATIRTTDRKDREGGTVLFAEEIQSSWHQAGRKYGYKGANQRKFEDLLASGEIRIEQRGGARPGDLGAWQAVVPGTQRPVLRGSYEAAVEEARSWFDAVRAVRSVPDAPFKTSWQELAVKRLLRMAADGGYRKLSFTTGQMQIDRYPGLSAEQQAGMQEAYDRVLPSLVKKIAKRYGMRVTEDRIEGQGEYIMEPDGLFTGATDPQFHSVLTVEIDPAHATIIQRGLPVMSQTAGEITLVPEKEVYGPNPQQPPHITREFAKAAQQAVDTARRIFQKFGINKTVNVRSFGGARGPGGALADVTMRGIPEDQRTNQYEIYGTLNSYEIRIWLGGHKTAEEVFASVMHEMGHILSVEKFRNAPESTRQLVFAAFDKFHSSLTPDTNLQEMLARRDNAVIRYYETRGTAWRNGEAMYMLAPEQRQYWSSFEEWFTEQVVRWATTSEKPLSIVDKFFAQIGTGIRAVVAAINKFRGGFEPQARPDLTGPQAPTELAAWLDSFIDSAMPFAAEEKHRLDQESKDRNQRDLDKAGHPELEAPPVQPETIPPREAIDKLFKGNPPPEVRAAMVYSDRFNRFYKWMLSLPQVAKRNTHISELQRYKETVAEMHLERQTIMDEALSTMKAWKALGRVQADAVSGAMDDLMNMTYRTAQEVRQKVVRWPTPQEYRDILTNNNVSQEADVVLRQLARDFSAMLTRYETLMRLEADKISDPIERTKRHGEISLQIANLQRGPYFPAMRFGKHTLTVRDAAGATIHFETFEGGKLRDVVMTRRMRRMQRELQAQFDAAGTGEQVSVGVLPESAGPLIGMPPGLVDMIAKKLPQLAPQVRDVLEQIRFELAPAQSFKHRFQHKKRTPGYSEDFQRAYAHYFFHGSNHLVRVKYADQLRGYIKALHDQKSFMPDSIKRGEIANFLQDHFAEMMDPKADFAVLRGLVFHWALGASAAAATLNMTQLVFGSYPFLAQYYGDRKAIQAILKAGAQISTYYKRGTYSGQTAPELRAIEMGIQQGIITEAMAPELAGLAHGNNLHGMAGSSARQMWNWGLEKSAWMFQMTEQMNRRITFRAAWNLAMANPTAPRLRKIVADEYALLYAELRRSGWTDNETVAFIAAKDAVESTQYVYAAHAQPRFMRGKMRTVFVFQSFRQNTLFMLWNNPGVMMRYVILMTFLGGLMGIPGAEDAEDFARVLAWKFLGKDFDLEQEARKLILDLSGDGIPPDLILHGMSRRGMGIPAVMDLLSAGMGKMSLEQVKDRFLKGSASGVKPAIPYPITDRSRAIAMGQIFPVPLSPLLGPPKMDSARAMAESTQRAAGAAFGIGFNMFKFATDYKLETNDPKRWERAMPRSMAAVSKAYRAFNEERERNRSGATVVPYNRNDTEHMAEVVGMALGYRPLRESAKWDATMAVAEAQYFMKIQRGTLLQQFHTAKRGKDKTEVDNVIAAIKKFNNDLIPEHKALAITSDTVRRSFQARERNVQAQESGIPTSKTFRGQAKSIQRLYPEATVDVRRVK